MPGTLYLVATPIGNLEDITLRALRVLREADWIAAEDTRRTAQLLAHYQISTPLVRYDEHSHARQAPRLLRALDQGQTVALVSDAGTPLLHDPGYALVRAALDAGHTVVPIPGPSAVLTALVASGLPAVPFAFAGYPPRKAAKRRRWLQDWDAWPHTLVLLEAPHRLLATLDDMAALWPDRALAVGRELTKRYEEFWRGTVAQAAAHFREHPPRGEFTLVLGPKAPAEPDARWPEAALEQAIARGLAQGEAPSALARQLARASGWPRREVYQRIQQAQGRASDQEAAHAPNPD
ncbi:MAG: 16S rRNA (cytidine(1402)-2'-O)-methyltransferase [Chloroflexi bacterium]|nr:16S rRNA (cytidine(1402)-2'-O)-methyltransferase [Chloroflexota bacterium]